MAEYNNILHKYLGNVPKYYNDTPSPIDLTYNQRKKMINELRSLSGNYKGEYYYHLSLSDTYALFGEYEEALKHCSASEPLQTWTLLSEKRLNLKVRLAYECDALDLVTLFPKKLTAYGKKHIHEVVDAMNNLIKSREDQNEKPLLKYIVEKYPEYKNSPDYFYNGTMVGHDFTKDKVYSFGRIKEFQEIARDLMREAENLIREDNGIPKVGHGWIGETELYYKVKEYLPTYEVIQHGRPTWLKRQHLDVYIPDLKLAFEYQGLQHDQPVEFFGGEEAFLKNQERDKKKFNLCKRDGVKIIYLREGYNFNEEVIRAIEERIRFINNI
ncbi:hypothetical protein HXA34_11275 [Salipaludibacillus agaradhaerens]|jgi:hypothetical protein|uniref:hypothetical protein n=1 Tax=Salipaludibacillus agaradhaerens TaxID=76935 RepID=UPI0021512CB6|nr:hypothetical protein [Salipaludibacillus agaradhaerens]MCR6106869.1 hypothetical protein [Salipaludibacillus agaradhaerens]MCR6118901.1 hypothetical protein [Salipaludibacillus agaradhaerens]